MLLFEKNWAFFKNFTNMTKNQVFPPTVHDNLLTLLSIFFKRKHRLPANRIDLWFDKQTLKKEIFVVFVELETLIKEIY